MTERIDLSKYRLVFSDEFNTIRLLGQGTADGFWRTTEYWGSRTLSGNGERQFYVDPAFKNLGLNPFSVDDGILTIRAERATSEIKPHINNLDYTSGMITSERGFSMQYGYFEIKAQMPAGKGLWPAFWLLAIDGQWPPELDVVEVLGHEPDRLFGTQHYKDATGAHKMDHTINSKGLFNSSTGFHTYGIDWQADKVTWYYDGIKVGETTNKAGTQPMYLIANLAVGGYWPGNPDANTKFPADMKIDYIRAYSKAPEHKIVGIPTSWKPVGLDAFTILNRDGIKSVSDWRYSFTATETKVTLAGSSSRFLTGNDLDNFLGGSSSSYNELLGGKGNDTLQGGSGTDVFIFRPGDGYDVILDLRNTVNDTDKIRLEGFHFRHLDDVIAWSTQVGPDVIMRLAQDQAVLLKNVELSKLTPDMFIFVNPVAPPADAPILGAEPPPPPPPAPAPTPVEPVPLPPGQKPKPAQAGPKIRGEATLYIDYETAKSQAPAKKSAVAEPVAGTEPIFDFFGDSGADKGPAKMGAGAADISKGAWAAGSGLPARFTFTDAYADGKWVAYDLLPQALGEHGKLGVFDKILLY